MELEQAIITGSFGVFVAIVTWVLAGLREIHFRKQERIKEKTEKLESLYADTISLLEMLIRVTESGDNYDELKRELSNNNGLLRLLASDEVNNQLEETSILVYRWSSLHRKGAPKKMSGDMAMITSQDSKYKKEASEMYPQVNNSIVLLIGLMKKHLEWVENA